MDKISNNTKKIKIIENKNGNILKFIDKNNKYFSGFGELYFSWIKKNSIKAWKKNKNITSVFIVPMGKVKFVLLENGKFKTYNIGENNYKLLRIKPKIWYGFKGIGRDNNLIVSLINKVHNNKNIERKNLEFFKYNW